jgi:flagellar biosynthesis protein FlhA
VLTEYARNALARSITQAHSEPDGKLYVITLDPRLEDMIKAGLERGETGSLLSLPPAVVSRVAQRISTEVERATARGHTPVVLCSPQVRLHVKRIAATVDPAITVVSYNEVLKDARVESLGLVGLEEAAAR